MSLVCNCAEMPSIFYYKDVEKSFYEHLEKIDAWDWYELYKCKATDQHWRKDIQDHGQETFVVKIEDVNGWKEFDDTLLIKDLVLKNRGGTTDKVCVWANCENKRVNGVAYCIDHLYESGARR